MNNKELNYIMFGDGHITNKKYKIMRKILETMATIILCSIFLFGGLVLFMSFIIIGGG